MPFDSHFVVPDAAGGRLLLLPDGDAWRLPHWPVAEGPPEREQGFPATIRAWVRERTGIDTMVLRWQNVEAADATRQTVYVLERRGGEPTAGRWVARDELGQLTLAEPHQRPVLEAWFADGGPPSRQPWQRPGWYDEALRWVEEQLGTRDVQVSQLNTKTGSCLLRVRTADGGAYFKALPAMYAREPLVTHWLAALFPERTARVLAVDSDRHWQLTGECPGAWLPEVDDLRAWEAALGGLAEIQVACAPRVDELLELGCPYLRLHRLPALLDELLLDGAPRLLDNGAAPSPWTSVNVTPAELEALRSLAPRLRAACGRLAESALPDTLEHGDLHPGQVFAAERGPVYIDWADCAISHPFFSPARFLGYIQARPFAVASGAHDRLRDAYLEPWTSFAPIDRLREAFGLAFSLRGLQHALKSHQLDLNRRGIAWERSGVTAAALRSVLGQRW